MGRRWHAIDGTGDNFIVDTTFLHLYSVLIDFLSIQKKVMITIEKMIAVDPGLGI